MLIELRQLPSIICVYIRNFSEKYLLNTGMELCVWVSIITKFSGEVVVLMDIGPFIFIMYLPNIPLNFHISVGNFGGQQSIPQNLRQQNPFTIMKRHSIPSSAEVRAASKCNPHLCCHILFLILYID